LRPIKLYNPHVTSYKALAACVRYKDLLVTDSGIFPGETDTLVLQDKNFIVRGTEPCISYLDEKYPHPPFLPNEPEKRACIRMMITGLLLEPDNLTTYNSNVPSEGFFSGDAPCILDLFLYELSDEGDQWDDYKARLDDVR